jgi:hypothetical protein
VLVVAAALSFALAPVCDCPADGPASEPAAHGCCEGPGLSMAPLCCATPSVPQSPTILGTPAPSLTPADAASSPLSPTPPTPERGVVSSSCPHRVLRI